MPSWAPDLRQIQSHKRRVKAPIHRPSETCRCLSGPQIKQVHAKKVHAASSLVCAAASGNGSQTERLAEQVVVVLGTQWGDEGKGKLVDILARQYDVVARAQVCHQWLKTVISRRLRST